MNRNLKSSYKKYLETTDNPVDLKTYLHVNGMYNKFLINKVLEGKEVTLPGRMGFLSIRGVKPKITIEDGKIQGLAPDWVKTKELWEKNPEAKKNKQLMYHVNSHTDGIRYSWHWSKSTVLVENKTLYALRLTRNNKRAVYSAIKNGKQFATKN